ncbi:MAG TPA: glycosyltransferase family 2 protein [Chthoniobacterales bacterium]|jgi:glycosyltransferase involved in cell wall biosynthesis
MDTAAITPLILTFNEEPNIGRVLSTLKWAQRIVILDSGSSDGTLTTATSFPNVEAFRRDFDSHENQWNYGMGLVETEWALTLDADYILSMELFDELRTLSPTKDIHGYSARFRYCIKGCRLRTSVYPPRAVLVRKTAGSYVNEGHTQMWRSAGRIEQLVGFIDHDDRKSLSRWIQSQDRYMQIEARHLLAETATSLSAQDRLRKKVYFAPLVMPLYLLFGRGLILDGWPGLYYASANGR